MPLSDSLSSSPTGGSRIENVHTNLSQKFRWFLQIKENFFNCFFRSLDKVRKSWAYEQSIDHSIENISAATLNRIINSVTCLNLSCPFDCQWCWESRKGFDPSSANRWLLWLGPGWESFLKSRQRVAGGKSPVAVPKKTISLSREKERACYWC